MDVSPILDQLNECQRQAVSAPLGHCLVLAGAGSGKTRVLVHRIAWLIQVENVSPFSILAVTFTNKAAGEMRHRIETLLHLPARGMWVGTFHGIAHRILRAHWQAADLPENFQILDSDDQYRMIRRVLKSLDLDESKWSPKQAQWFINNKKDAGIRPDHLKDHPDVFTTTMRRVYQAYEEACQRGGLVDFAELLLRVHELFLTNVSVLQHYQERFCHILVDEFQDTNTIQYAFIKLLAGNSAYVMSVGDDDQSIYGWRGAKIENIHRFSKDYKNCQTIRLEQNYRSTSTILNAANSLIENNDDRLGKKLWTEGDTGELISLFAAINENDEAHFIVKRIQDWHHAHTSYRDIAILYRSNAQSRVLEEALIQARIPYRVYGGLRFFDRAEIKDALAYLRLLANRHDDAAMERVINRPTRGIGDKTLMLLRDAARANNTSLWQAAIDTIAQKSLTMRANNALVGFLQLIDDLAESTKNLPLYEQTEHMLHASGLRDLYQSSKNETMMAKVENLDELITATKQFTPDPDDDLPLLHSFLSHAALEAGDSQSDAFQDCVQLMTLHSAKGLEFPLVFMAGVEEGLFPHKMSMQEPGRLEEERRLCYVGMTRAMQKLYLSYAEVRRLHGQEEYHRPSRFIREIPKELLDNIRFKSHIATPVSVATAPMTSTQDTKLGDTDYKLGQRVNHPKFGDGTILNFEGRGAHTRVQVHFDREGSKWLVLAYAKLSSPNNVS